MKLGYRWAQPLRSVRQLCFGTSVRKQIAWPQRTLEHRDDGDVVAAEVRMLVAAEVRAPPDHTRRIVVRFDVGSEDHRRLHRRLQIAGGS